MGGEDPEKRGGEWDAGHEAGRIPEREVERGAFEVGSRDQRRDRGQDEREQVPRPFGGHRGSRRMRHGDPCAAVHRFVEPAHVERLEAGLQPGARFGRIVP